jgi:hypothetical protein
MATVAKRNGAPTRTVMATTGHTSEATLDIYIEDAELFTDPRLRLPGAVTALRASRADSVNQRTAA